MEPKSSVTLPVEHADVTGVQLADAYAPQEPVGAVESFTKSCTIQLTRGYAATVDAEDFLWLSKWKWCAWVGKEGKAYAVRREEGTQRFIWMHRVIMGAVPGGPIVDHKDIDSLNNRRSNLRFCNNAENSRNSTSKGRRKTSRYKGVCRTENNTFVAQITLDRKNKSLGFFKTELEAARAYDAKARELFGAFARCNFPNPIHPSAGGAA